mmetsp:Transcript_38214/g.77971  ORF Transcript_38214/g.77971 Transcript_38214/m.77971 type:complete len:140 (-) Transcript_38214:85-504(-)
MERKRPKARERERSTSRNSLSLKQTRELQSFQSQQVQETRYGGAANSNSPAVKKARTNDDIKCMTQSEPYSFVGRRVSKYFDGECFFGKITKCDDTKRPPFWHVVYDDGDEEDFSSRDLIKALEHYEKHGKDDTKHLTR